VNSAQRGATKELSPAARSTRNAIHCSRSDPQYVVLRAEYARTIDPARALTAEALNLEHKVSDLVNEAYGLTPEEVALMWQTAPPRMPIAKPG